MKNRYYFLWLQINPHENNSVYSIGLSQWILKGKQICKESFDIAWSFDW